MEGLGGFRVLLPCAGENLIHLLLVDVRHEFTEALGNFCIGHELTHRDLCKDPETILECVRTLVLQRILQCGAARLRQEILEERSDGPIQFDTLTLRDRGEAANFWMECYCGERPANHGHFVGRRRRPHETLR